MVGPSPQNLCLLNMLSKKRTSGYCPSCHKNVPHRRLFSNPVTHMLDVVTLSFLRLFRVGPWFCVHCDNKVLVLPGRRRDALDYRSAALGNEKPIRQRTKTNPSFRSEDSSSPNTGENSEVVATPAVPVGNFIKSEKSLTNRSQRLGRFTEKYRDAVVRRILSGSASIAEVRQDKQLSEGEIVEWIADMFARSQKKIDDLERLVKSISKAGFDSDPIGESQQNVILDAQPRPR